jgi:serine/threonine protein kinase
MVSPHVVQYYGSLWAEKNRLWILMEYCQAGSVRDLMETINLPSMKEKQIAFVMHTTLQVSSVFPSSSRRNVGSLAWRVSLW